MVSKRVLTGLAFLFIVTLAAGLQYMYRLAEEKGHEDPDTEENIKLGVITAAIVVLFYIAPVYMVVREIPSRHVRPVDLYVLGALMPFPWISVAYVYMIPRKRDRE